ETVTPTATVTATTTPGPILRARFWSFAVKFVCGDAVASTAGTGEPPVCPGSYATEINIHNPNYRGPISIFKKAPLLVDKGAPVGREPNTVEPRALGEPFKLADDGATMDDCTSIWEQSPAARQIDMESLRSEDPTKNNPRRSLASRTRQA